MTKPSDPESEHSSHELEDYGGGAIQSRHGYLPIWLLVVYAILFLWSLYYMVVYWGGLGPGRI
jgi:hypothetical protein